MHFPNDSLLDSHIFATLLSVSFYSTWPSIYPLSQETKGRDSTGNPLMEVRGEWSPRWFWNSKAMKTSWPLGGGLNVSIVAPRVGPLMANALQFACVEVWIAMWLFWWQKPSCIQCVNNILHTTHWGSTNEWRFRLLLNKTKDFHKWCHRTLLKIKVLLVSHLCK